MTVVLGANCPACREELLAVAAKCAMYSKGGTYEPPASIAVYPKPKEPTRPRVRRDALPERLAKAYIETLRAWDNGHHGPAATNCRRLLEGAMKEWLKEPSDDAARKPLAKLIEETATSSGLAQPLRQVAEAIRDAGNHFVHYSDTDATPEEAQAMIRLLEMVLEYLFVMKQEAQDFIDAWKAQSE